MSISERYLGLGTCGGISEGFGLCGVLGQICRRVLTTTAIHSHLGIAKLPRHVEILLYRAGNIPHKRIVHTNLDLTDVQLLQQATLQQH
jgi:hypothetical protein